MNWYRLDENANPVPCKSPMEYHKWHESMPPWGVWYQSKTGCGLTVAWDKMPGGQVVSTVFLGLDHSFAGGRPLLRETMVFADEHSNEDLFVQRYHTYSEAMEGHRKLMQERVP